LSSLVQAQCPNAIKGHSVEIEHVYDGDTVLLKDGRRVRLIGINAPEMAKHDQPAEFFAQQSTEKLKQLIASADLSFVPGRQQKDRYKRWLGHLFADGKLLTEQLLADGLAFHITIPPNLKYSQCLKAAEKRAHGKGLWQSESELRKPVLKLKKNESGFRVLSGRVSDIRQIRKGYLLEIDQRLAVKVEQAGAVGDDFGQLRHLKGLKVRVRGWIKPKKSSDPKHYMPWSLVVRHPSQLEVL